MCDAFVCDRDGLNTRVLEGLRVWPQVDVVFGNKALPVVELSCVPVRVILHVGDLDRRRKKTTSMLDLVYFHLLEEISAITINVLNS